MTEHPSILCVDDEPKVLEGLKLHLRRYYEVLTATGGQMALELLEREGPFAVVLSDMRMPGMDGATLLGQIRQRSPDTTRMLLTGQADLDSAIAAVNEGQLFRFLTKPCPPPVLLKAFEAGVAQYRLMTAQRVLLEQTLRGVIQTLTDILALTHPIAFGRANRLKRHAVDLAKQIGIQRDLWPLEVAAMLSQIGCIILPNETLEKLYQGGVPNEKERAMVERLPAVTEQLLSGIPRLEAVLTILRNQDKPYRFNVDELDAVHVGGAILKIAGDFDALINQGHPVSLALDTLRGHRLVGSGPAGRSSGVARRLLRRLGWPAAGSRGAGHLRQGSGPFCVRPRLRGRNATTTLWKRDRHVPHDSRHGHRHCRPQAHDLGNRRHRPPAPSIPARQPAHC